jgi:hypothetical protein
MTPLEKLYVEKLIELVIHYENKGRWTYANPDWDKWKEKAKKLRSELVDLRSQIGKEPKKPKQKRQSFKICAGCGSFAHGNPGHDIIP